MDSAPFDRMEACIDRFHPPIDLGLLFGQEGGEARVAYMKKNIRIRLENAKTACETGL